MVEEIKVGLFTGEFPSLRALTSQSGEHLQADAARVESY
jgi:hypothetical protein